MKAHIIELRTRQKRPVYIGHNGDSLVTVHSQENAILFGEYNDAYLAATYWMLGTEKVKMHKVDVTDASKIYRVRVFLSSVEKNEEVSK